MCVNINISNICSKKTYTWKRTVERKWTLFKKKPSNFLDGHHVSTPFRNFEKEINFSNFFAEISRKKSIFLEQRSLKPQLQQTLQLILWAFFTTRIFYLPSHSQHRIRAGVIWGIYTEKQSFKLVVVNKYVWICSIHCNDTCFPLIMCCLMGCSDVLARIFWWLGLL